MLKNRGVRLVFSMFLLVLLFSLPLVLSVNDSLFTNMTFMDNFTDDLDVNLTFDEIITNITLNETIEVNITINETIEINISEEINLTINETPEIINETIEINITEEEIIEPVFFLNVKTSKGKLINSELYLLEKYVPLKSNKIKNRMFLLNENENSIPFGLLIATEKLNTRQPLDLIFPKGLVTQIRFKDLNLQENAVLGLEEIDPKTIHAKKFDSVVAIDPSGLDFTEATATITATANWLYKCKDWNFETATCPEVVRTCVGDTKDNTVCEIYGGWQKIQKAIPGQNYVITLNPQDPAYAQFNETYNATDCGTTLIDSQCVINSSLLMSRGLMTIPEPNASNTIDNCTDGNSGAYLNDESVENITITNLNRSTYFGVGDTINISAWVYCNTTLDNINFVYTNSTSSIVWTVEDSITSCTTLGLTEVSKTIVLDEVIGKQAIRVMIQYSGSVTDTCGAGAYDDNDDVMFNVLAINTAPTTPTAISCDGGSCSQIFEDNVTLQCSGSTDTESDAITYVIEANYTGEFNTSDLETSTQQFVGVAEYFITTVNFTENWDDGDDIGWTSNPLLRFSPSTTQSNSITYSEAYNSVGGGAAEYLTYDSSFDLTTSTSAEVTAWIYIPSTTETPDYCCLDIYDGTTWNVGQINTDECADGGVDAGTDDIFTKFIHSFAVGELVNNAQIRITCDADNNEVFYIDDINVAGINTTPASTEANLTAINYANIDSNFSSINNISIKIQVDSYNPEGSVATINNDPDLYLEIYNGSSWIEIGNFDLNLTYTGPGLDSTSHNFTLNTTDATILTAWGNSANQDFRIKAIYVDYNSATLVDEINYSNVWVTLNGTKYEEVANHTSGSTDVWNFTGIDDQTNIDLRCRTIDLAGSNSYSSYYDSTANFTIGNATNYVPVVTLHSPADNHIFITNIVNLSCNATDDNNINNVTLYHNISGWGPNETLEAAGVSPYQANFSLTGIADGTYVWNCLAFENHTDQLSSFAVANRTFSVDTSAPLVTSIIPTANTNFSILETIEIAANVTDATSVDVVQANITNSSGDQIALLNLTNVAGDKYNASLILMSSNLKGRYNITILANDTYDKLNDSETSYFNIANSYPTIVSLSAPTDGSNQTTTNITFTFNATDDFYSTLATCVFYSNKTGTWEANKTWTSVINATNTSTTINFPDGSFIWNIKCTDDAGLSDWYDTNNTFTVNTTKTGIFVYELENTAAPKYRLWNEYNYSGFEKTSTLSAAGDIAWIVTKANHERKKAIIVTEDKSNNIRANIYNTETGAWSDQTTLSTSFPSANYRSFDVSYEELSGDALLVYETSSVADTSLAYAIWNGTSYSTEATITLPVSETVNWVSLTPRRRSDEIMLLVHTSGSTLYAIPWNGTAFDTSKDTTLSSTTTSATEQHFGFAWEETSGQGLAVYGEGTTWSYIDYTGTSWGTESSTGLGGTDSLDAVRLCTDITSNHIGVIFQDSGDDIQMRVWDGGGFLTSPPAEDLTSQPSGANNANIDCAWLNDGSKAIFGWVESNALEISYRNFTKANTWSDAGTTGNFAQDDIYSIRFIENENTTEFMVVAQDLARNVSGLYYNGSNFNSIELSPFGGQTEVLNGNQESATFDWFRYDATPNVTNIYPSSDSFAVGQVIEINTTVVDDGSVDTVLAQITYPNSTIEILTLTNQSNNKYNDSFTIPSLAGTYTILIIANDTSIHNSTNNTESTTFSASDNIFPAVTEARPTVSSSYNISTTINISVNATDTVGIDTALAQIDYPNGTSTNLTLTNSVGTKYNITFDIPVLIGLYNITFFVNDTSNNLNNSITTNFTAVDSTNPLVNITAPLNGSTQNVSSTIEIAANVTDNILVRIVKANITNSTGDQIELLTLTNVGGDKYNGSHTIPAVADTYTVTILANDSSSNTNHTEYVEFIVSDGVAPAVTAAKPDVSSSYNISTTINISVNVTDAVGIDTAIAQINYPNGTSTNLTLINSVGTKYNNTFDIPVLIGLYNITFFVNDTSNNLNNSITTNFTTVDSVYPAVTAAKPDVSSSYNISTTINISVNATDAVGIDTALAQIDYPNGTSTNLTLINSVGDKYNITFDIPVLIGLYNITFFVNDTSNNLNNSITTNFTVIDSINPLVTAILPQGGNNPVGSSIEIAANVTDNIELDVVLANINYSNGSLASQIILTNVIGTKYNSSYTIPNVIGNYTVTILANDSSSNTNNTETSWFNATDSIKPSVSINLPANGTNVALGNNVTITATVTDNVNVSAVIANVNDGTTDYNLTLVDQGSDVYSAQFTNTSPVGTYVITILANDTSNNLNNTVTRTFFVQDNETTIVNLISPEDNYYTNSASINLVCNASDTTGLENISLYHNISGTWELNQTNTTITGTNNQSNFSLIGVPEGSYIWNCEATDSGASSAFASANYSFITDLSNPVVTAALPSSSNETIETTITIQITATDTYTVNYANANISYPNGTSLLINLSTTSGNNYSNTFDVPTLIGTYNITYFVYDLAGNVNDSVETNFTAVDITNPVVASVVPTANSTYNVTNNITIQATVTDQTNISVVLAQIDYPNGTSTNVTLSDQGNDIYNNSIIIPDVIGRYNITYIVNDTSNNINNSVTTYFNVNDIVNPVVTDARPVESTTYNISTTINISVNATDDVNISAAIAQIDYPNGTSTNINLTNSVGTKYNNTFDIPVLIGLYNITFFVNDTSNNLNNSITTNFTAVDSVAPAVVINSPNGEETNISSYVELSVNATDLIEVDTVLANITYPNSTIEQVELNLSSGSTYSLNYTTPNTLGNYNITYIVNDTSNNINNTEITNFTKIDSTSPTISIINCTPSNINLSQSISCYANATDTFNISTVNATIVLPNGTTSTPTVLGTANPYNFTFSTTSLTGQYNITWNANDTSGNTASETHNFNVSDVNAPSINLETTNNYNTSNSTITFSFNITDNYDSSLSCSLYVNNTLQTTDTITTGVSSNLTATSIPEGDHNWTIQCTDASSNSNTSSARNFTVDQTNVIFYTLTTSPDTANELDPNVSITVYANVSDNDTAIDYVTLKWKISTDTNYTDLNLTYNSSSSYYENSFTPTAEGTYNLSLYGVDVAGNSDTSANTNLVVTYEYTWTALPSNLDVATATTLNENVTLGNVIINNTGDFPLNFTISSDSSETTYDASTKPNDIQITNGSTKNITVYDQATEAVKNIDLTINSTSDNADPSSNLVEGTIVVTAGLPVLEISFIIPATETQTTTVGDTGVTYQARIENIGTSNASNITFTTEIPDDWELTFGSLSVNLSQLLSGDSYDNVIEVTIPTNATTGTFDVVANATGVSSNGTNLTSEGLIFADSVAVTVQAADTDLGSSSGSGGSSSSVTVPTASTGGGSGSSSYVQSMLSSDHVINSTDVISLIRGEKESFRVSISNIFGVGELNDVSLTLEGYLTEYMTSTPDVIESVPYNGTKYFNVVVNSPEYMEEGKYDLIFVIKGTIGNFDFIENRHVTLLIHSLTTEEIKALLLEAYFDIEEMEDARFSTNLVNEIYDDAEKAILEGDYGEASLFIEEIAEMNKISFELKEGIEKINERIDKYNSFTAKFLGFEKDFPETKRLLNLALLAFEREDYTTALERLRNAELTLTLESKEFRLLYFVLDWWWLIVLILLVVGFSYKSAYREFDKYLTDLKLKRLEKEEETIIALMKTNQTKRFKEKSLSASMFDKKSKQQAKRLIEIRHEHTKLKHKVFKFVKPEEALVLMDAERKELNKKLKKLQTSYFVDGKLGKQIYDEQTKMYRLRLSEVETEHLKIELQSIKKVGTRGKTSVLRNKFQGDKK